MQFQAPYDIMDMRNQRMKEDALRQEQSMAQQEQIFGALGQLAGAYSENRQLEAKASSYDDIGKILNTAMFKDNPDAAAAFGNLQKEKDARKKVMGYEQLFSMVGPMSNMMMAQGRMEQAPVIQTQRDNAATNRMYEAERLRREREAMAKIAAGQGTMTMPSNINADVIP